MPASQLLGLFNTLLRKTHSALRTISEKSIAKSLNMGNVAAKNRLSSINGALRPLDDELEEAADELKKKQKEDLKQLKHLDLTAYQVQSIFLMFVASIYSFNICLFIDTTSFTFTHIFLY